MTSLLVAAGGALGALIRYVVDATARHRFDDESPLGVLAVNVIGSFLLGLAVGWSIAGHIDSDPLRVIAGGLLGGFTTFSTVAVDTVLLGEDRPRFGATYLGLSLLGGLGAAALGMLLGGAF